jgi:hypothetical protein
MHRADIVIQSALTAAGDLNNQVSWTKIPATMVEAPHELVRSRAVEAAKSGTAVIGHYQYRGDGEIGRLMMSKKGLFFKG